MLRDEEADEMGERARLPHVNVGGARERESEAHSLCVFLRRAPGHGARSELLCLCFVVLRLGPQSALVRAPLCVLCVEFVIANRIVLFT